MSINSGLDTIVVDGIDFRVSDRLQFEAQVKVADFTLYGNYIIYDVRDAKDSNNKKVVLATEDDVSNIEMTVPAVEIVDYYNEGVVRQVRV